MGIIDFVKAAGALLGIGSKDHAPSPDDLRAELTKHGLPTEGIDIKVDGDTVDVSGNAADQSLKEKIILALGNVAGVAKVSETITTATAGAEAKYYTVVSGDTLSGISKKQYGDANKYMTIFEANKPMLSDPNKIYPGQVLRIPPLG